MRTVCTKSLRDALVRLCQNAALPAAVLLLAAAVGFFGYRAYQYGREAAAPPVPTQHPVVAEARTRMLSGDTADALALLSFAHRQQPANAEIALEYAAVLHLTENYAEAEAALEELLEIRPGWPEAICLRGMVRRDSGDLDAGIRDLEAAAAADPDNPPVLYALAHAVIVRSRRQAQQAPRAPSDMERALGLLQRSIELDPDRLEYLSDLGLVLRMRGDWAAAATTYERLAQRLPEDPGPLATAAECALKTGDAQRSAELARAAVKRDPDHARAYEQLARALHVLPADSLDAEEYEQALRAWWQEGNFACTTPVLWLADAHVAQGDPQAAEAVLREAIAAEKARRHLPDAEVHTRLGRLLLDAGREEEGARELAVARKLHGQWDPLGALVNRIKARPEDTRDDRLALARKLDELGWPEVALVYLEPLLSQTPRDVEAEQLARELGQAPP